MKHGDKSCFKAEEPVLISPWGNISGFVLDGKSSTVSIAGICFFIPIIIASAQT
jgi:hypothetical protein